MERHVREWDVQEAEIVKWAKKEKGVQVHNIVSGGTETLGRESKNRWRTTTCKR